ncbi:hypothetical protein [Rhizobium phage RHph_X2_26]|nr:hypothetical protein [Rhizobium phage RHph_X2_26]
MKIDWSQMKSAAQIEEERRAALFKTYSAAIQGRLDAKAQERHYDGIQSAISYRDDPNPAFAAEAAALFQWRSAVWTHATAEFEKVVSGAREQPTIEAFIAELPELVWPH